MTTSSRTLAAPPRALRWIMLGAAATVLAVLAACQTYLLLTYQGLAMRFGDALATQLPLWYTWAVLVPVVHRLARVYPLDRQSLRRSIPILLGTGAVIALAHGTLGAWLDWRFYPEAAGAVRFVHVLRAYLTARLLFELLVYAAMLGGCLALDYASRARQRALEAARLEAQLAEARLRALEMQLQPHFLFNTLHAIGVLIEQDPPSASHTVTLLGDLLRYTLRTAGASVVPLAREMEFLRMYLAIEQLRFADRLTVVFEVENAVLDAPVPPLILQPLVENAVRHGVAPRSGPGRIEIRAHRVNGRAELSICDDGPGLVSEAASAGLGIGLATTRARLGMLYGEAFTLNLENAAAGGLCVSLTVPMSPSVPSP